MVRISTVINFISFCLLQTGELRLLLKEAKQAILHEHAKEEAVRDYEALEKTRDEQKNEPCAKKRAVCKETSQTIRFKQSNGILDLGELFEERDTRKMQNN